MVCFTEMDSPVGMLLLCAEEKALTGVWMNRTPLPQWCRDDGHPVLQETKKWLDAYFRGEESSLDIPLHPSGTPFQQAVWEILRTIPPGQTRTYGSIAREMAQLTGKEKMSAQAIGQAVGANPISILVPCHRVVGIQGDLTGYAGGLEKKIWLLKHEGWTIRKNKIR